MKKTINYELLILNVILLVYPIEMFKSVHADGALGAFTPFRIIILPLCIFYLILYKNKFPKNLSEFFVVGLFFVMGLLGTLSSSFSSLFSFVGNIVQFLMAYNIIKNHKIQRDTLFVISLWVMMQVPYLIISLTSGAFGMELRFTGLFFDPNYLCSFLLASVWAAFFLLRESKSFLCRLYCFFVISMGLLMIFLSFSRGGLLTSLFTIMLYLMINHKKIFVLFVVISVPLISAMIVRSQYLTWSDAAANPIDGMIFRVFTLSDDADQLTANRSAYITIFIKNINDYMVFGTDVFEWNKKYNGGMFVHNGIIELFIQSGVIAGFLFVVRFVWSLVKCMYYNIKYKQLLPIWIILFGSLITLTFLSYTSKFAWLCMGALFAFSDIKAFKKQIVL